MFFLLGQYILFLILVLFVIASFLVRDKYVSSPDLRLEVLEQFGYDKSPVYPVKQFMVILEQENFSNVLKIVCKPVYEFDKTEWKTALQLYLLYTPHQFHRPAFMPANSRFGKMLAERMVIAEKEDGKLLIGYALHSISDKELRNFYQKAEAMGVVIDDKERIAGSVFHTKYIPPKDTL